MKIYVLVKFGREGEPYLDIGGEIKGSWQKPEAESYNARPRVFRNEKMARNFAHKHGAQVVELDVEAPNMPPVARWLTGSFLR